MKLLHILIGVLAISSMVATSSPAISVEGKMKQLNLASVNQPRILEECVPEECKPQPVVQHCAPRVQQQVVQQQVVHRVQHHCAPRVQQQVVHRVHHHVQQQCRVHQQRQVDIYVQRHRQQQAAHVQRVADATNRGIHERLRRSVDEQHRQIRLDNERKQREHLQRLRVNVIRPAITNRIQT